jgi:hypothetical protein
MLSMSDSIPWSVWLHVSTVVHDLLFLNAPFGDSDIENCCECVMKSSVGKATMKRSRYGIQDRVSRGPPPPLP